MKEKYLTFLDDLQETGVTNMLGAATYLDAEFPELTKGDNSVRRFPGGGGRASKKAHDILLYWMKLKIVEYEFAEKL